MPMPAILLKMRLQHMRVPVNFAKLLRTYFSKKHLPVTASITTNVRASDKRSIQVACPPINPVNQLNCWRQLSPEKYFSAISRGNVG